MTKQEPTQVLSLHYLRMCPAIMVTPFVAASGLYIDLCLPGEVLPFTPRSPFTLPACLSAPSRHRRQTHRFSTNTYIPVRCSWLRDPASG